MQSKSYLFLAVVVALTALSAFFFQRIEFQKGLDIEGGVRLTYKMDLSKVASDQRAATRENVRRTLENRAVGPLGVVEPVVVLKGEDEVIVELPGMDLKKFEEAQSLLKTTARIEWYHALNVSTEKIPNREYTDVDAEGDEPQVWFRKRNGTDDIKPGTPEYKKVISGWKLILAGDELADAQPVMVGDGYIPSMTFNREGARKMEKWSRENTFRGEKLAAVLDGVVLNIAPLQEGAIISNQGQITGTFSTEYVKKLTDLLRSGSLPVSLEQTSSVGVDPTIGKAALEQIVRIGAIALTVIGAFLLVYYVFPGFVALLALALYILFCLTALKLAGATFSLASIAGFILSVGMAVDANILVFERFKEEMRANRPLNRAIELGFNRALPAIIDSNACTILTSLVLANLGTGPVKGFATTLIIGVLISLFTAIVVTRSLLVFFVGTGIGANPKLYGLGRGWFGEKLEAEASTRQLKIVEKSKLYFAISAITIIPGVIFLAMGGLKPNVEFTGGYEGTYASGNLSAAQVRENLEKAGITGFNVKVLPSPTENLVSVTVPEASKLGDDEQAIRRGLATAVGVTADAERGFSSVSATVRDETIRNAILGIVLSSGLIIFWLAIRFGFALGGFVIGLRFAFSVILALIHDVLVVIGLAAIMGALAGWEISALFISAMLTVIGFSTHDTIVIFDRIRENLRKPLPGEDIGALINRSITQSFARSLNTSATIVVTLILLIFWGSATTDLQLFNAAMLVGILSGTYSSIFNAAPILYLWDKAIARKRGEEASLIGMARQAASAVRLTREQIVTSPTPAAGPSTTPSGGAAGYGQTKRRRASEQKGVQELDD